MSYERRWRREFLAEFGQAGSDHVCHIRGDQGHTEAEITVEMFAGVLANEPPLALEHK